jgi:hypothetical protein
MLHEFPEVHRHRASGEPDWRAQLDTVWERPAAQVGKIPE